MSKFTPKLKPQRANTAAADGNHNEGDTTEPIMHRVPCERCRKGGHMCEGEPKKACVPCRKAKMRCNKVEKKVRARGRPNARLPPPPRPVSPPKKSTFYVEITSRPRATSSRQSAGEKRKSSSDEESSSEDDEVRPPARKIVKRRSEDEDTVLVGLKRESTPGKESPSENDEVRAARQSVKSESEGGVAQIGLKRESSADGESSSEDDGLRVPARRSVETGSEGEDTALVGLERSVPRSTRTVDLLADAIIRRMALRAQLREVEAEVQALTDRLTRERR